MQRWRTARWLSACQHRRADRGTGSAPPHRREQAVALIGVGGLRVVVQIAEVEHCAVLGHLEQRLLLAPFGLPAAGRAGAPAGWSAPAARRCGARRGPWRLAGGWRAAPIPGPDRCWSCRRARRHVDHLENRAGDEEMLRDWLAAFQAMRGVGLDHGSTWRGGGFDEAVTRRRRQPKGRRVTGSNGSDHEPAPCVLAEMAARKNEMKKTRP